MEVGKKYRIIYNPRCSDMCEVTCLSCKVDNIGEYTGRNWVDREGNMLYEMWYEVGGSRKYGIFGELDILELNEYNE